MGKNDPCSARACLSRGQSESAAPYAAVYAYTSPNHRGLVYPTSVGVRRALGSLAKDKMTDCQDYQASF